MQEIRTQKFQNWKNATQSVLGTFLDDATMIQRACPEIFFFFLWYWDLNLGLYACQVRNGKPYL
jgi:hypothetical protein